MLTRSRVPLTVGEQVSFCLAQLTPARICKGDGCFCHLAGYGRTCSMVLSPCVDLIYHSFLSCNRFCLLPACSDSELALKAGKIHVQVECCLFSHRYSFAFDGKASAWEIPFSVDYLTE